MALLLLLLLACENKDRKTQLQPPVINPVYESLDPHEVAVQVIAGDDTTLQSNALMNSLLPDYSVAQVLQELPDAEITQRQPTPNRHIQGQVDTLITIKSDSAIFQFYSMPNEELLRSFTLSRKGISLGQGLEIGMLAEEVARRLPPLRGRKAIPQTLIIRAEQVPSSIRLRFEKNRLAFAEYDGYVD